MGKRGKSGSGPKTAFLVYFELLYIFKMLFVCYGFIISSAFLKDEAKIHKAVVPLIVLVNETNLY